MRCRMVVVEVGMSYRILMSCINLELHWEKPMSTCNEPSWWKGLTSFSCNWLEAFEILFLSRDFIQQWRQWTTSNTIGPDHCHCSILDLDLRHRLTSIGEILTPEPHSLGCTQQREWPEPTKEIAGLESSTIWQSWEYAITSWSLLTCILPSPS